MTVRSAVSRLVFARCAKKRQFYDLQTTASRESRSGFSGQTFHVDKDPCLQSVLRAKLCIPNKALLWETLYTLHIHGIFVLKLFHHLMIFLGSSPAFWLLERIGFGQIHSEKVDFLHVPFGASQPQQKIPTKKSCILVLCVNRTSHVKKEVYVEVMIRKDPPKQTKISWGHLF